MDCYRELNSVFRTELGGIVALLHILLCICRYHTLTTGNITLYCDCQSAINKTIKKTYGGVKCYLGTNYDSLHKGRTLLKELKAKVTITLSWINGHYEGEGKSVLHSLNEVAHHLAYNFLQQDQGTCNPGSKVLEPHLQRCPSYLII